MDEMEDLAYLALQSTSTPSASLFIIRDALEAENLILVMKSDIAGLQKELGFPDNNTDFFGEWRKTVERARGGLRLIKLKLPIL